MMEFARVDVKEIKSHVPRSKFSEGDIERLADLILQCGGIFRPLIVKQVDIDHFILLDGFLEYYSAVRAREKDPRQGELVNTFVVPPKDDIEIVQQQIEILRVKPTVATSVNGSMPPTTVSPHQEVSSSWITSFETRLSEIREELFQAHRTLDSRVSQVEKRLEEKRQEDLLTFINHADKFTLINKLISLNGAKQNKIEAIYEARMQKENAQFDSYQDLVESTQNWGAKGLLSLIDNWYKINSE